MMLHVYLIRDERANQYGTPIYTAADENALESDYKKSIRNLNAQIEALTPEPGKDSPEPETWMRLIGVKAQLEDSVIYKVGEFDDQAGVHNLLQDPVLLFRVKDLL